MMRELKINVYGIISSETKQSKVDKNIAIDNDDDDEQRSSARFEFLILCHSRSYMQADKYNGAE